MQELGEILLTEGEDVAVGLREGRGLRQHQAEGPRGAVHGGRLQAKKRARQGVNVNI